MAEKRLFRIMPGLKVVTVLIAVMLLCGCSTGKKASTEQSLENTAADEQADNTDNTHKSKNAKEAVDNVSDNIRILSKNSNHKNMLSTDDGMYRISNRELPDGSYAYCMYYVDYASAKEIVLCNDSSCQHDSTDCMGIIEPEGIVSPALFMYKDKLYIFSTQDDSGSVATIMSDAGEAFSIASEGACLYQVNPDGTDRKRLYDFPEDMTIDENVFEWNGKLVFCKKRLKEEKTKEGSIQYTGVDRKLVSFDVDSCELTELAEFPQELSVDGTYKDCLVCERTVYPDGYSDENTIGMEFEEWRKLYDRTSKRIVLFDIKSGKETEICNLSNKKTTTCVVNKGKLYIEDGSPTIKCIDIATLKASEIVMKDNKAYSFVENYGDRIYCWPAEDTNNELCFWEPETNDMARVKMNIKGTNLKAELCTFNDNYIIAVCDGKYKKSELQDDAYDEIAHIFGLVKKSDIYSGKGKYTPVKMCSDGLDY